MLDSVPFKVFLTDKKKALKIVSKAQALLSCSLVSVRDLASFIGLVINAFYAVSEAPLFYRSMERNKLAGLGPKMCFDNTVAQTVESRQEIEWWLNNVGCKNGKPIRPLKVY